MNCQGFNEPEFVGKIRVERRKKAQKPRIEKLRRDRINGSLNEIKNLVLEALNKDVSHYSKMEKADILEMAVHFLRGAHARSRIQGGLQSGVEHFSALRDIDCKQRHLPSVPRNPRLTEDQLLERVDPDILTPPVKPMPMLHYALSPFASAPMVTMAAQPSIVWPPYPSPPPSPASQVNGVNDMELKQTPTQSRNGSSSILLGDRPHIQLTRPSNRTLPLWRPW